MTSAITVEAVGTPVHFALNTARPIQIPAGATPGKLLLMLITGNNGATFTKSGMAGWTALDPGQIINSTFDSLVAFYKYCVAGEPGTSVTAGNFASNVKGVGVILSLDGADNIDPQSINIASLASNTLGTTHAVPTATADVNSTPILVVTDRASTTIQTTSSWTWPAGYTHVVTNQGSTDLNSGEAGIGVAIGGEVTAGNSSPSGNVVGNNLSHWLGAVILLREFVPADSAQLQIMDDAGWHDVEIVGVGEAGLIRGVQLVDHLSGLHTPDFYTDFSGGSIPNPIFSFTDGATIDAAAADPDGTSGYGVYLKPNVASPFAATLTKSAATAPTSKPWAAFKLRFKNKTLPPTTNTYDNLIEIGNSDATAPKNQFTVYWNNRVLWADFGTGDAVNLGITADSTDWHTVEARVYFGATTYTAKVRIDGTTQIDMTSANDKEVATAEEVWIGYPGVQADYERYIGSFSFSADDTDPGWLT